MSMLNTASQQRERRSKRRTVFLLEPENREKLDKLSALSGQSLGELIRRSVSLLLNEQGKVSA